MKRGKCLAVAIAADLDLVAAAAVQERCPRETYPGISRGFLFLLLLRLWKWLEALAITNANCASS